MKYGLLYCHQAVTYVDFDVVIIDVAVIVMM